MLSTYMQAETKLIDAEATNAPWLDWQRQLVHSEWLKLTDAERAIVLRRVIAALPCDPHCGGTS